MFLALLAATSCIGKPEVEPMGKEEIKELQSVEIRDFEGEALDSIMGWRDNSIEGP